MLGCSSDQAMTTTGRLAGRKSFRNSRKSFRLAPPGSSRSSTIRSGRFRPSSQPASSRHPVRPAQCIARQHKAVTISLLAQTFPRQAQAPGKILRFSWAVLKKKNSRRIRRRRARRRRRAVRKSIAHLHLLERGSGNSKEDTVAGKILCDRMTRAGQNDTGSRFVSVANETTMAKLLLPIGMSFFLR